MGPMTLELYHGSGGEVRGGGKIQETKSISLGSVMRLGEAKGVNDTRSETFLHYMEAMRS